MDFFNKLKRGAKKVTSGIGNFLSSGRDFFGDAASNLASPLEGLRQATGRSTLPDRSSQEIAESSQQRQRISELGKIASESGMTADPVQSTPFGQVDSQGNLVAQTRDPGPQTFTSIGESGLRQEVASTRRERERASQERQARLGMGSSRTTQIGNNTVRESSSVFTTDSGREGRRTVKRNEEGEIVSIQEILEGATGQQGQASSPFATSGDSSGGFNFATAGQTGTAGVSSGGPAFTGLLGATQNLAGQNLATEDEEDENVRSRAFQTTLSSPQFGQLSMFDQVSGVGTPQDIQQARTAQSGVSPQQRLDVSVGDEIDVGDIESRIQERQSLIERGNLTNQDVSTVLEGIKQDALTIFNELQAQDQTPERPVFETVPEQQLMQQAAQQGGPGLATQFQQRADQLKQEFGVDTLLNEFNEKQKQLDALTESVDRFVNELREDPDLPVGLAQRRINRIQEEFGPQIQRVQNDLERIQDQVNIRRNQFNSALDTLAQEFNLRQTEQQQLRQQQQQVMQRNRQELQSLIDSGAIANLDDQTLQQAAQATGFDIGSLQALRESVGQTDRETQVIDVGGQKQLIDTNTGEVIQTFGSVPGTESGPAQDSSIPLDSEQEAQKVRQLSPLAQQAWNNPGILAGNTITPSQRTEILTEMANQGLNTKKVLQGTDSQTEKKIQTIKQGIQDALEKWRGIPDGLKGSIQGRITPFAAENNPEVAEFRSAQRFVGQQLARLVESGRLSDQDREFYRSLMPSRNIEDPEVAKRAANSLIERLETQLSTQVESLKNETVTPTQADKSYVNSLNL